MYTYLRVKCAVSVLSASSINTEPQQVNWKLNNKLVQVALKSVLVVPLLMYFGFLCISWIENNEYTERSSTCADLQGKECY